jgi:hypothetical protein
MPQHQGGARPQSASLQRRMVRQHGGGTSHPQQNQQRIAAYTHQQQYHGRAPNQSLTQHKKIFGAGTNKHSQAKRHALNEGGEIEHVACRQPPKLDRIV